MHKIIIGKTDSRWIGESSRDYYNQLIEIAEPIKANIVLTTVATGSSFLQNLPEYSFWAQEKKLENIAGWDVVKVGMIGCGTGEWKASNGIPYLDTHQFTVYCYCGISYTKYELTRLINDEGEEIQVEVVIKED